MGAFEKSYLSKRNTFEHVQETIAESGRDSFIPK